MSTIYNLKVFHSLTIDRWASINYTLKMSKKKQFPKFSKKMEKSMVIWIKNVNKIKKLPVIIGQKISK